MASRSALRKPERYISWKAARNSVPRVRPASRDIAPLRRDRFLTADIPISMHVHAGRCRAEHFHALPGLAKSTRQIQFLLNALVVPGETASIWVLARKALIEQPDLDHSSEPAQITGGACYVNHLP
jgi:hypothetical protein